MQQAARKPVIMLISAALALLFVVAIALPIESTSAQRDRPQRTVVPPSNGGAEGGRIQLTPIGQLPRGENAVPDFSATVEALKNLSGLDAAALQATAQAVIDSIPALEGEFSAEDFSAWLDTLVETGSISYDRDAGTLTFTAQLDEDTANAVIDEALTAAGYTPSSVSVDFVNGYIVVTATDVSVTNQISGTVVLTMGLSVVDGEVVADIIGATVNGQPMPSTVVEEWEDLMHEAFSELPADAPFEYTVDQIAVTDSAVVITMTIDITVEN